MADMFAIDRLQQSLPHSSVGLPMAYNERSVPTGRYIDLEPGEAVEVRVAMEPDAWPDLGVPPGPPLDLWLALRHGRMEGT